MHKVLVIDVGGSRVKLACPHQSYKTEFDSGPELTPEQLVSRTRETTEHWDYDCISLGYPGLVRTAGPAADPGNLGGGWVGFKFDDAFGKPVRLINDAALQALGGYKGGRMLFLGVGTGLGSTLVVDGIIIPLELGSLRHPSGETFAQRLGKAGLAANGRAVWQEEIVLAIGILREALVVDYVLLGGGNASLVDPLPSHTERGGNEDAVAGGIKLWEDPVEPHDRRPSFAWRVL